MKQIKLIFSIAIASIFLSMLFNIPVLADDANSNASQFLTTCKTCGKDVSVNALTCPYCGENLPALRIKCPKCQSTNIVNEKQGFSLKRSTIGCCLFGGVGLAGGTMGMHEQVFMCRACGNRWKAQVSSDRSVITKSQKPTTDKGCLFMVIVVAIFVAVSMITVGR